jgi:hypothetical protein
MKRLAHLGFPGGLIGGCLIVGLIWLGTSGVFDRSSSHLPYGYKDIASIHLQPVPEGPSSPPFVPHPNQISEMPLVLVADLVPDPLPKPLNQPHSCDHGGDLIITLKNDTEITYGPCDYPWQISQLWGAMIETADLTEPSVPNRAALGDLEQVRQSLKDALERNPIGKAQFAPTQIDCSAIAGGRDEPPPGYLCATVLHSETGTKGIRRRFYCVALVAGRVTYVEAPKTGICTRFQ